MAAVQSSSLVALYRLPKALPPRPSRGSASPGGESRPSIILHSRYREFIISFTAVGVAIRSVSYIGSGRVDVAERSTGARAAGEVQLAVAFTGLCGTDMHIIHGSMDGRVMTPLVFGHEMSLSLIHISEPTR